MSINTIERTSLKDSYKIFALKKRLAIVLGLFSEVDQINHQLYQLGWRQSPQSSPIPVRPIDELIQEFKNSPLPDTIRSKIRWLRDNRKINKDSQATLKFLEEYLNLIQYPGSVSNEEGKVLIDSMQTLSKVYTPGVAQICLLIEGLVQESRDLRDVASFLNGTDYRQLQREVLARSLYVRDLVFALAFTNSAIHINRSSNLEIMKERIAQVDRPALIVTDNTAILGLGDIGIFAGMPVMYGKKMIMNDLGDFNAIPITLETRDPQEIIRIIETIAPKQGAINLEDISAPRCFYIETELKKRLQIPVFHDDQHGTAIVVLAALINALTVTGRRMDQIKVVINGAGAAGLAIADLLGKAGVPAFNLLVCDSKGIIYEGRTQGMNPQKELIAKQTNSQNQKGGLGDALKEAHVFVGVSVKDALNPKMVASMRPNSIILALANPDPEILPEAALRAGAAVVGTGRSDFPNQVNNALVFPGLLGGSIKAGLNRINSEVFIKVAETLAACIEKPTAQKILPEVLDRSVHQKISRIWREASL